MKKTWKMLGNINLTIIILLLLVADLATGYFSILGNERIFKPLGDFGLIKWGNTFGKTYPAHTIWFLALFILLVLLALNTFACTTDKVIVLIKNRRHFNNLLSFLLKFSVHIIHYSLIIILTGYLITYLSPSICSNEILTLNQNVKIPGTKINIMLQSVNIDYYHGTRLKFLDNRAYNVNACLLIAVTRNSELSDQDIRQNTKFSSGQDLRKESGEKPEQKAEQDAEQDKQQGCIKNTEQAMLQEWVKKNIGINNPFLFNGVSFTLKNFGPKYKYGMKQQPYISLIIRKTPGIKLYFAGTMLFALGLFMYLYQWFFVSKKQGEKLWKKNSIAAGQF